MSRQSRSRTENIRVSHSYNDGGQRLAFTNRDGFIFGRSLVVSFDDNSSVVNRAFLFGLDGSSLRFDLQSLHLLQLNFGFQCTRRLSSVGNATQISIPSVVHTATAFDASDQLAQQLPICCPKLHNFFSFAFNIKRRILYWHRSCLFSTQASSPITYTPKPPTLEQILQTRA